jgi:hypothetical protein
MSQFISNVGNDVVAEAKSFATPSNVSLGVLGAAAAEYYYSRSLYASAWIAASSLLGHAVGHVAVTSNYIPDALMAFPPIRSSALVSTGSVYVATQYLGSDMREGAIISGANYVGSIAIDLVGMMGM